MPRFFKYYRSIYGKRWIQYDIFYNKSQYRQVQQFYQSKLLKFHKAIVIYERFSIYKYGHIIRWWIIIFSNKSQLAKRSRYTIRHFHWLLAGIQPLFKYMDLPWTKILFNAKMIIFFTVSTHTKENFGMWENFLKLLINN